MRLAVTMLMCIAQFLLWGGMAQARTPLVVYTAVEPEYLEMYKKAFEERHPDVEISYVRDSAGPIAARLLAEKDAPRADVILGLSAISLEELNQSGVLQEYRPNGVEKLAENMRDPNGVWTGANAWGAALCVNAREAERLGLAVPQTWDDLVKPEYAGRIVMPHPVSSSTGYMMVFGWLQVMGEERGWAYMEALHKNMKMYVHSGAKPAQMAAQGEILIGLSSRALASGLIRRKAPLVIIEPSEGISWDVEASALPRGSRRPEAARLFLDFMTSDEVANIAAVFTGIAARAEFSTEEGARTAACFQPMNFQEAAVRKKAILEEWRRRFEK